MTQKVGGTVNVAPGPSGSSRPATAASADALALVDDARTDIYAAIQKTDGAILRFGRSRRLATAPQKLTLALRDGDTCAHPGCAAPWNRCDADHDPPWDEGGLTNVESMRHLCSNEHHPHRHETGTNITRQANGTWTADTRNRRNRERLKFHRLTHTSPKVP